MEDVITEGIFDDIKDGFDDLISDIGDGIGDVGDFFMDLLGGGDGLDKFKNFNAETWCDDEESEGLSIKAIICMIIDIIKLFAPLARFVRSLVSITVEFIFGVDFLTELFIILSPTIPIFFLVGYFFDTL